MPPGRKFLLGVIENEKDLVRRKVNIKTDSRKQKISNDIEIT